MKKKTQKHGLISKRVLKNDDRKNKKKDKIIKNK